MGNARCSSFALGGDCSARDCPNRQRSAAWIRAAGFPPRRGHAEELGLGSLRKRAQEQGQRRAVPEQERDQPGPLPHPAVSRARLTPGQFPPVSSSRRSGRGHPAVLRRGSSGAALSASPRCAWARPRPASGRQRSHLLREPLVSDLAPPGQPRKFPVGAGGVSYPEPRSVSSFLPG